MLTKEELKKMIEKNPFTGLNELLYMYIRDEIVSMRILPGEKINMTKIAEEMEMSRTPVRSALELLVQDGLVERMGEKGYRAKTIDWDDCLQQCNMRKLIEGYAAESATAHITKEELDQLSVCIQNSIDHGKCGDMEAFLTDDFEFHKIIARAARNRYLFDAYMRLTTWSHLYQNVIEQPQKRKKMIQGICREHTGIYLALKNHFAIVAKSEMEAHIQHIFLSLTVYQNTDIDV